MLNLIIWFSLVFVVKTLALLSITRDRWQRSLQLALVTSALWVLLLGLGNFWLFVVIALIVDYGAFAWLSSTNLRDAIRPTIIWELYSLGYGSIIAIVFLLIASNFIFVP